jgi:hypothetical protein
MGWRLMNPTLPTYGACNAGSAPMVSMILNERHWHLGPGAVDANWHRRGIGTQLLLCARLNQDGEVAFLETDKPDSVRFYARKVRGKGDGEANSAFAPLNQ